MASSKEYLNFILEQLDDLENIKYRAMMGEYILYYNDKIVGGIYDDRLLVKPVKSALDYVSNIEYDLPYPGAKEMLLIMEVDDKEYLTGLFMTMLAELPARKVKK
ncbi:MAG: TfoX/Sxy family protein [Gemella morbillorum]|uniref:TfoX/Sxy family protein n=1 Tax=Gemella morbillorum TaxID=29391 RepID=UPI001CB22CC6|nr:TfoX/Sxy family protein [Gemella morbillorum]MBF1209795.1 TfoX/Sxy family protein [Gemella morbillorum]